MYTLKTEWRRPAPMRGLGRGVKNSLAVLAALGVLLGSVVSARADYPLASHRFIADPAALEHNGRLYLYGSNDDDNTGNAYIMHSIVCTSTDDLKNWTDHGVVFDVPRDASWARYAWAPAVIARNDRFYLYFGDNAGSGIGVASSPSPSGPFVDARGSRLVSTTTPGASGPNQWYFDPAVFIDDDGQAYLYFGGNGTSNGRVVQLGSDMISLAGPVSSLGIVLNFFEALFMHKLNGTYYLSYSAVPAVGQGIHYGMSTASPTSGFTFRGEVLRAPTNFNNNHHAFVRYQGAWYAAYHNRSVSGGAVYKRNLCLDRLNYNPDGTLQPVISTTDGLPQLKPLDPYVRVEAETIARQNGTETEPCSEGGLDVGYIENGDWIRIRGVDFGSTGASSFMARVASATEGGNIELRLDSLTGPAVGTCEVQGTGGWQTWTTTSCSVDKISVQGVHDLYLRFTGGGGYLFNVNWWQFQQ
jgi:arabinoxylan arabinofuranohydrolase